MKKGERKEEWRHSGGGNRKDISILMEAVLCMYNNDTNII